MSQLPLDFDFPPRFGADDFLVSPNNVVAFETLRDWPAWPSRILLLVGCEGSGKSHLSTIWAERAAARRLDGADLGSLDPYRLAATPSLIDGVDRVGNAEAALFHALNVVRERGQYLLMTAQSPPDRWGLKLNDLLSRLRVAPLLRLDPPDDHLLRAVFVKLFVDRQLVVDTSVVDYLVLRTDRSLAAARRIVDALDRASLADQRRITRPVASRVLAELET